VPAKPNNERLNKRHESPAVLISIPLVGQQSIYSYTYLYCTLVGLD